MNNPTVASESITSDLTANTSGPGFTFTPPREVATQNDALPNRPTQGYPESNTPSWNTCTDPVDYVGSVQLPGQDTTVGTSRQDAHPALHELSRQVPTTESRTSGTTSCSTHCMDFMGAVNDEQSLDPPVVIRVDENDQDHIAAEITLPSMQQSATSLPPTLPQVFSQNYETHDQMRVFPDSSLWQSEPNLLNGGSFVPVYHQEPRLPPNSLLPGLLLDPVQLVPHNTLPLARQPHPPSDFVLHWIVERAALQPKPIPMPNLGDFFAENPSHQLARDLKILLKPMKYKPLKDLLALYWIIYLNIRVCLFISVCYLKTNCLI